MEQFPTDFKSNNSAEAGHVTQRYSVEEARENLSSDNDKWWLPYINCRGASPELFFTDRTASIKDAKALCLGCVVKTECLDYALVHKEMFGVWGGLTLRERRPLLAKRAAELRSKTS